MQAKFRFLVALTMAVLLPTSLAFGKPGGGGGGGGGHHGGGGGGSHHSSGGGGSRSSGMSGGMRSNGGMSNGGMSNGGMSNGGMKSNGGMSGGGMKSNGGVSGVPRNTGINPNAGGGKLGGVNGGGMKTNGGNSGVPRNTGINPNAGGTKIGGNNNGGNHLPNHPTNTGINPNAGGTKVEGSTASFPGRIGKGGGGSPILNKLPGNRGSGLGGQVLNRGGGGQKGNFLNQHFNGGQFNKHVGNKNGSNVNPVNRVNHDSHKNLNKDNSFVKKHDIGNNQFVNNWTHHNNSFHGNGNNNFPGNGNGHNHNHNGNGNGNGHHHHHNNFGWNPWLGWGGGGLWGYGYGYPTWQSNYYSSPCYGYNYYYTTPYGTPAVQSTYGVPVYAAGAPAAGVNDVATTTVDGQVVPASGEEPLTTNTYEAAAASPPGVGANPTVPGADGEQEVTELDMASASAFADQGEVDFKAGNYHAAAKAWQHSLVDDPKNGAVMMMMAQALFAKGKYEEAAGATQAAMQMLPDDKWGVVVSNYQQLYGNLQDFTDQLKALEAARDANPESPAIRFLLGFQFGYLNYPKQAVRELDKALTIAPRDFGSRKVRDLFAAKWPEAPPVPAAAAEAAAQLQKSIGAAPKPAATPAAGAGPGPSDATPSDRVGS